MWPSSEKISNRGLCSLLMQRLCVGWEGDGLGRVLGMGVDGKGSRLYRLLVTQWKGWPSGPWKSHSGQNPEARPCPWCRLCTRDWGGPGTGPAVLTGSSGTILPNLT